jgi:hypothetical protein
MNSRDQREPVNELEALIRQSLRASVARKQPSSEVRRRLLQQVGERMRRRLLWLPISTPFWMTEPQLQEVVVVTPPWQSLLYLSAMRTVRSMGFPSQIL